MKTPTAAATRLLRSAAMRAIGFAILWLLLAGSSPTDLGAGGVADVARRALDPRLPLSPGFAVYPVGLSPGPGRNMFTTLMSLSPGTVPTGPDPRDRLLIHCLDVEQPITAQLAAEEALFARVIGRGPGDD